jgi:putative transposase
MDVSRSGYYDWREREVSRQSMANVKLDGHIKSIYTEHRGRYGYRRICEELRSRGICASLERVRRRMRKLGIKGIQSCKFKHITNNKHKLPTMSNLLNQDFSAKNPNQVWVADITYIRIKQQWLYLAVVIDLYSRQVVGWQLSERIDKQLAVDALKSAPVS